MIPTATMDDRLAALVATGADEHEELDRLAAVATTGDREAIQALLAAVQPVVLRYCRSLLDGRADVFGTTPEELTQDTLLALLTGLPDHDGIGVLAVAFGLARRKVADARVRRVEFTSRHVAHVRRLLDQLPARQREVLRMRIVEGLSTEETAMRSGLTAGAVRVTQHQAMHRLRRLAVADARVEPGADDDLAELFGTADRHLRLVTAADGITAVGGRRPDRQAPEHEGTGDADLDALFARADAHLRRVLPD